MARGSSSQCSVSIAAILLSLITPPMFDILLKSQTVLCLLPLQLNAQRWILILLIQSSHES